MRQSAAVLCPDHSSLATLEASLETLGIDLLACKTRQQALEMVVSGRCSTLIVDFDLPGAQEVISMASLLPPAQKPALLAVASQAWPGTGQAFQSGAHRILYRPLDDTQIVQAVKSSKHPRPSRRKSDRYEMKTLVYLELPGGTVPAVSVDIGEHGLALQATEPVPVASNLTFRCLLPGTKSTLHGHADVIWASDEGRAGLFFAKLSPEARKHLRHWLTRRASHSKGKDKHAVRELLPPADAHVSYAE